METRIVFYDNNLEKAYQGLKGRGSEDKKLLIALDKAFEAIKEDYEVGEHISMRRLPKKYAKDDIKSLWKYPLPRGWRLIYGVAHQGIIVLAVVLDWCDHKDYKDYEKKYC